MVDNLVAVEFVSNWTDWDEYDLNSIILADDIRFRSISNERTENIETRTQVK